MGKRSARDKGWETRRVNDQYLEDQDLPAWIKAYVKVKAVKTLPALVSAADKLNITKQRLLNTLPKAGFVVVKHHRWEKLVPLRVTNPPKAETPSKPPEVTTKPEKASIVSVSEVERVLQLYREETHKILEKRMQEEGIIQRQLAKARIVSRLTST